MTTQAPTQAPAIPISVGSPTSSEGSPRGETVPALNPRERVAYAFGRGWTKITNCWAVRHPSWTFGLSTITGLTTASFYSLVAIASAVAFVATAALMIVFPLIPNERIFDHRVDDGTMWLCGASKYLTMSLRLVVRGVVSAVPLVGNMIIYAVDKGNRMNEKGEEVFCLLSRLEEQKRNLDEVTKED